MVANVKVSTGINDGIFALPLDTPVSLVRASLIDAFNISRTAFAFVNGVRVCSDHRLKENDWLEFLVSRGRKAGENKKVQRLPVLSALSTLNRHAKRYRDLARLYYNEGNHTLAGKMRKKKERIHFLKGQVLHYLVETGVLTGGKFHCFENGLWAEVLEGGGFSFCLPCPPQDLLPGAGSIMPMPKQAKEPALDIAHQVIDDFLKDKKRVKVYQWESRDRHTKRTAGVKMTKLFSTTTITVSADSKAPID